MVFSEFGTHERTKKIAFQHNLNQVLTLCQCPTMSVQVQTVWSGPLSAQVKAKTTSPQDADHISGILEKNLIQ